MFEPEMTYLVGKDGEYLFFGKFRKQGIEENDFAEATETGEKGVEFTWAFRSVYREDIVLRF